MNINKIGYQERLQQKRVLVNDYSFEYAKRFSQQISAQKKPYQTGIFDGGSQQQSLIHANSSGSIMNRIGSPGSVFYATGRFIGFPQCDYRVANSHPFCPQISKKYDAQIPPYQQFGDGFYTDQSIEQACSPNFVSLQSAVKTNTCSNIFSEKEQILQLKSKLLGDCGTLDNKREVSIPSDENSDLSLSSNSYVYQLAHMKQSARTCSNAAAPSGSSVTSSKTRIRWSRDLHDRFVDCVNRLGGAEKATPKAILRLMDSEGLTIYHVKSHLQKYRIAKYMPDSTEGKFEKRTSINDVEQIDIKTGMQLKEALQLQLEVQRQQLEIQRNLQLRIEEQGKQLKLMFEQQQRANKSVLTTRTSNDKSPDDPSGSSLEHEQILIPEGSGNSQFPSKIS